MKKKILFVLVALLSIAPASWAWKPLFAGHRGSLRGVMNTAEAYRNGVDFYHFDGLECDVRVTKDGHYVILHDNTTGTVCPSADIDAQQHTLAELKALDFEQTRDGVKYCGKICTVEEYLDICVEKGVFPIIELKWTTGINNNDMSNYAGLLDLVSKKGLREKAIFLTSMANSIAHIKANYPDVTCQYLLSSDSDEKFDFCKKWGVNPSFSAGALTEAIVARYRQAGMEVAVWTVNTEANYKKYAAMGCFMMTCDYLRPDNMPEMEKPEVPEPPEDAIEIDAEVVWLRSANGGNLPADFASKATGSTYTTGQQAAMRDQIFYVNDYGTRSILVYDRDCSSPQVLPYSDLDLGGSAVHGITTDDASNIVLRYEDSYTETPHKVRVYPRDGGLPIDVDFTINTEGQHNFVYASGDLLSEEGGCLYFLPNGQTTVSVVKISCGKAYEVIEHKGLSVTGSTASVILPIDNDPDHFIYQVRANGFYLFDGEDKGSLLTTASTTTAPGRNSSLGGAYMNIGGHMVLAHPSGGHYNGGFSIKDMTADRWDLATFRELGTTGYKANASTGTFMRPVKVAEDVYHLHCYTMGHGYGVYEIKAKGAESVGIKNADAPEKTRLRVFPNPVVKTAVVSHYEPLGELYVLDANGRKILTLDAGDAHSATIDLGEMPSGLYIVLNHDGATVKVLKK